MTNDEEEWMKRVERYGRRTLMRPELIHEWAINCAAPEREFFQQLYENRPLPERVGETIAPRFVVGTGILFTDLSLPARYLVETACERIWGQQ